MEIKSNISSNLVEIEINNLPVGMAVTIGNFYRRMFLLEDSSTEVIAVTINNGDVATQFQTIPSVVQDAQTIISNLNLVQFDGGDLDEYLKLVLIPGNADTVKASDISTGHLTVVNPDQLILQKKPEARVEIELHTLTAKGFRSKERNALELKSRGVDTSNIILLDSNHKSIDKAWYEIVEESTIAETMKLFIQSSNGGLEEIQTRVMETVSKLVL